MTMTEMIPPQDPNALVAVTHDSEWITLIKRVRRDNLEYNQYVYIHSPVVQGRLTLEELTREGRLEEFLSENYSLVSQPENSKCLINAITPC